MEEAERLCDRIAIIDHGKRIALGTPTGADRHVSRRRTSSKFDQPSRSSRRADFARHRVDFTARRGTGSGWSLRVDSLAIAVPQLLATIDARGSKLIRCSTHAATLEDLFVAMTGRELRDA